MKKEEVLRRVTEGGLVAVVRAASGEEAKRITDACIAGGVVGIEITFTVPGAHHVVEELAKVYGNGEVVLGVGSVLGLLAGLSVTASVLSRPLVTVLLGTPPIAWLVLAMLWFGMSDGTPVFTVFIACFPVVFASALQGTRTLDLQLRDMARAYRLPLGMALREVYGPHVLSDLFPAWVTALGSAWKVAVMAELLASTDGVGAALAASRSQLDTATTLGWISAVVGCLLVVEYGFLEPLKREVERWREAPR